MQRFIAWTLALIVILYVAAMLHSAFAAPSLEQVKRAMNLYPGSSTDINVNGQIVHVTFVSIQPVGRSRYTITVEAR
jgi:hypothetical protein